MHKPSFKQVYLIYAAILAILVLAATFYVRSLLQQYEDAQPEKRAWEAAEALAADAAAGRLWDKYPFPAVTAGPYEQGKDLRTAYPAQFAAEDLAVSPQSGSHEEDKRSYLVESGGFPLAEVHLRAEGPAVTKLALFTMRDWAVEDIRLLLEPRDYTLTLPWGAFTVRLNGQLLASDDSGTYTVSGLYLKPDFAIADQSGALANYAIKDGKILPEVYIYDFTLPVPLTVRTDNALYQGGLLMDRENLAHHVISSVAKPEVTISDPFGNVLSYEGGEIPLTYMTVTVREGNTVAVQGAPVEPDRTYYPDEYTYFASLVPQLPQLQVYDIAILQDNAQVTVTDPAGSVTTLPPEGHVYDLTAPEEGQDQVPEELGVDVLDIAQKWSLFMSRDLPFSGISPYLVRNSYQYDVAYRYAHGIDITFTSRHTLADPPFTDAAVTNFQQLADTCFSVDIHFVKHMRLASGMAVDDTMNERFYFVYYDDTDNNKDDPAWKIGGMKEIVDNGQA